MDPDIEDLQETTLELTFHNVNDYCVQIIDMWINELTTRSSGRSGKNPGTKCETIFTRMVEHVDTYS